jgi:hypothetical protein
VLPWGRLTVEKEEGRNEDCAHSAQAARRGRHIVTHRTLDEEHHDQHHDQSSDEPADNDPAGSSVNQAKDREREMEESGEENAR